MSCARRERDTAQEDVLYILNTIVFAFFIGIGLVGNGILLLLFSVQFKRTQAILNCHISPLIIVWVTSANFCVALSGLPAAIIRIHFLEDGSYPYDSFQLWYTALLEKVLNVFLCVSNYGIALLQVTRYIKVCHPLHARVWLTRKHVYRSIITICVLALSSLTIIPCIIWYHVLPVCSPSSDNVTTSPSPRYQYFVKPPVFQYDVAYKCFVLLFFDLVPGILIVFCGLVLIRTVRYYYTQHANMGKPKADDGITTCNNGLNRRVSFQTRFTFLHILFTFNYLLFGMSPDVVAFIFFLCPHEDRRYSLVGSILNLMQLGYICCYWMAFLSLLPECRRLCRYFNMSMLRITASRRRTTSLQFSLNDT